MPLAVTAIALFVGLIAAATAAIPTASRPLGLAQQAIPAWLSQTLVRRCTRC
jgi:hypothetical protein